MTKPRLWRDCDRCYYVNQPRESMRASPIETIHLLLMIGIVVSFFAVLDVNNLIPLTSRPAVP